MGVQNVVGDRVLVATTTTGTGTYQCSTPQVGYLDVSAGGVNSGQRVGYVVVDSLTEPSVFEIGEGVLTVGSPSTVTRATIIRNSSGGTSAVNWGAGTKYLFFAPAASRLVLLDSVGFLGVGTAAPAARLHIKNPNVGNTAGNNQTVSRFEAGTPSNADAMEMLFVRTANGTDWLAVDAVLRRLVDSTDGGQIRFTGGGGLAFQTQSLSRISIMNSGDIRIYSAANVVTSSGTDDGLTFYPPGTSAGVLQVSNNANPAAYWRRRGSDGTIHQFHRDTTVVGSISVTTTATAYNTSSDHRLKRDVEDLDGATAETMLRALRPRIGAFVIEDEGAPRRPMYLAHELATVLPHAVTGTHNAVDGNGDPVMQTAQYDPQVPVLVAALTAALDRISALEARVTALESA